jgi:hypothetical protein
MLHAAESVSDTLLPPNDAFENVKTTLVRFSVGVFGAGHTYASTC